MILFSPFLKTTEILVKLCDYVLIRSVVAGLSVDVHFTSHSLINS